MAAAAPPDLEKVMAWYEGWKTALGVKVQGEPSVQAMLNQALQMFNEFLELGDSSDSASSRLTPPTRPFPPRFDEHGNYSFSLGVGAAVGGSEGGGGGGGGGGEDNPQRLTYKDVVERFAAECDVVFMPTARMRGDGGRVYQFGSASIAIDTKENLVWLQESGGGSAAWNPVDLDGLKKAAA